MESPTRKNPIRLALYFVFAGLVTPLLWGLLPGFFFDTSIGGYLIYLFPISIILFIPLLIISRRSFNTVHEFDITYFDNRDKNGDLEIRYNEIEGGALRTILVKSLKAYPKVPLKTQGVKLSFPVEGTTCSLLIKSKKGTYDLQLGFDSPSELDRVYRSLAGNLGTDSQ